jgi:hypothetical protein
MVNGPSYRRHRQPRNRGPPVKKSPASYPVPYVAVVAARPHPRAALRPDCIQEEDAADDDAVLQNVVVVLVVSNGRALEYQLWVGLPSSHYQPDGSDRNEDCADTHQRG